MNTSNRSKLSTLIVGLVVGLGASYGEMVDAAEGMIGTVQALSSDTSPKNADITPTPSLGIRAMVPNAEVELGSPKVKIKLSSAPTIGPYLAPVAIVIWSDLDSPAARQFAPVLLQLCAVYTDKIRMYWKNLPRPGHPESMAVAEAAMAAYEQQNVLFWTMREQILVNQNRLDMPFYDEVGKDIRLDLDRFHKSMAEHRSRSIIEADIAEAKRIGVTNGPVTFVNGHKLVGAQSFAAFRHVIDAELAAAAAKK